MTNGSHGDVLVNVDRLDIVRGPINHAIASIKSRNKYIRVTTLQKRAFLRTNPLAIYTIVRLYVRNSESKPSAIIVLFVYSTCLACLNIFNYYQLFLRF